MDVSRNKWWQQTSLTVAQSSQAHQRFEAITDVGYSPTVVVLNGPGRLEVYFEVDGSLKFRKFPGFLCHKKKWLWGVVDMPEFFSETKRYKACRHYGNRIGEGSCNLLQKAKWETIKSGYADWLILLLLAVVGLTVFAVVFSGGRFCCLFSVLLKAADVLI